MQGSAERWIERWLRAFKTIFIRRLAINTSAVRLWSSNIDKRQQLAPSCNGCVIIVSAESQLSQKDNLIGFDFLADSTKKAKHTMCGRRWEEPANFPIVPITPNIILIHRPCLDAPGTTASCGKKCGQSCEVVLNNLPVTHQYSVRLVTIPV